MVGPASHEISRVSWYLSGGGWREADGLRDSHPLWCGVPAASWCCLLASAGVSAPAVSARNPRRATPDSLARAWFRQVPFRSPLLWELFRFLRVLRCFSSPTYLPPVRVGRGPSRPRGCPIRRRWAHGLSAAPPSFRCWTASFIGWSCRGILQPRVMSCLVMDDSAACAAHTPQLISVTTNQYELVKVHLVERWGLEPQTPCLQSRCSPS